MTARTLDAPLAVIGGGNMGSAIVTGVVRAGVLGTSGIAIAEPDAEKRKTFAGQGVLCVADAGEALAWLEQAEPRRGAGLVLLAVKPQVLSAVVGALASAGARTPRLVLSILAGVPTSRLENEASGCRVVRAMPNLPAKLGRGCTAMCAGRSATPGDVEASRAILGAVGEVLDVPETLMDAFTAVAGSGPAYLFYLAEAMERGAIDAGFEMADARRIVRATLVGAGAMLEHDTGDPAALRAAVTSPGGTTQAAATLLDRERVSEHVRAAILAARDRGRELAGESVPAGMARHSDSERAS